jgi:hypothetical protein
MDAKKRRNGLTVAQLAKRFKISERTVWGDIAAGRLRVRRLPNGWVRIPISAAAEYRGGLYRKTLLIIQDVMSLFNDVEVPRSDRYFRRMIASGKLPAIKASRRRFYIRSRDLYAAFPWLRFWQRELRGIRTRQRSQSGHPERPASERTNADGSDGLPPNMYFFTVVEIARLAGKTRRQVYHDIDKGALVTGWRHSRRILVPRREVVKYIQK